MTPAFPVIISAPSGAGKTTIAQALLQRRTDVGFSVTCTTRPPRPAERDGVDYFFLARDEFERRERAGDFAEHALVHGNRYGTLRSEIARLLEAGQCPLMTIDVQGAQQFVAAFPSSVTIFVLPPSGTALLSRLAARGSDDPATLDRRVSAARQELATIGSFEYVVVNDDLDHAVRQVSSIIDAEQVRRVRQVDLMSRVSGLVADLQRAAG